MRKLSKNAKAVEETRLRSFYLKNGIPEEYSSKQMPKEITSEAIRS